MCVCVWWVFGRIGRHTQLQLCFIQLVIIIRVWLLLLRRYFLRSCFFALLSCSYCLYFVSRVWIFFSADFVVAVVVILMFIHHRFTIIRSISIEQTLNLSICLRLNCVHHAYCIYFQLPSSIHFHLHQLYLITLLSRSLSLVSLIKIIAIIDHLSKHIIIVIIFLLQLPPNTNSNTNQPTNKPTKKTP